MFPYPQVSDQAQELDPADAALLKDDAALGLGATTTAMGGGVRPAARAYGTRSKALGLDNVGWLMKTQYISNDVVQLQKQGA